MASRDTFQASRKVKLIFGLDLGQTADHSALAGVERIPLMAKCLICLGEGCPKCGHKGVLAAPVFRRKYRYALRYLKEFPLGLSYPDQVREVVDVFENPVVRGSKVGVDYTGVGRPVYDLLKESRPPVGLYPMLTTSGNTITFDKITREYHVPKVEQVSLLQLLLQADLLNWHEKLPMAAKFAEQLKKYRVKITKSKNETFGAMSGTNDDLVSAVMTACWLGEQIGDASGVIGVADDENRSRVETAPDGVFNSGNGV